MSFQNPEYLWLLVALVPALWLGRLIASRRSRRLRRFVAEETWPILNAHVANRARWWKGLLLFLALGLAIVTTARPLWGTRERLIRERGIDVIAAIDVSQSMLATDVSPSRLEQARRLVRQIMASFPGQRIGLVPFAGDAFLQCPLTADYGIVRELLETMGPESIGTPGTDIGSAIDIARNAFREGSVGSKVLVLVTDGEDHGGGAIDQASRAAEEGVVIFALGIGSTQGSPIKLSSGELKEDTEGHKIITRLDTETLAALASATGGRSYVAKPGETLDTTPLLAELKEFEQSDFAENRRVIREERYQYPLAAALLLLLIEGMLSDRRRAVRRERAHASAQPREEAA